MKWGDCAGQGGESIYENGRVRMNEVEKIEQHYILLIIRYYKSITSFFLEISSKNEDRPNSRSSFLADFNSVAYFFLYSVAVVLSYYSIFFIYYIRMSMIVGNESDPQTPSYSTGVVVSSHLKTSSLRLMMIEWLQCHTRIELESKELCSSHTR